MEKSNLWNLCLDWENLSSATIERIAKETRNPILLEGLAKKNKNLYVLLAIVTNPCISNETLEYLEDCYKKSSENIFSADYTLYLWVHNEIKKVRNSTT